MVFVRYFHLCTFFWMLVEGKYVCAVTLTNYSRVYQTIQGWKTTSKWASLKRDFISIIEPECMTPFALLSFSGRLWGCGITKATIKVQKMTTATFWHRLKGRRYNRLEARRGNVHLDYNSDDFLSRTLLFYAGDHFWMQCSFYMFQIFMCSTFFMCSTWSTFSCVPHVPHFHVFHMFHIWTLE